MNNSYFLYNLLDIKYINLLFIHITWSFLIGIIILILSLVVATHNPYFEKTSAYECGFEPFEDARNKFSVKFYVVAILFIIFDIEILYLLPWLINLSFVGFIGFWSMMFFLVILTIGFIYEMVKGALDWEGSVQDYQFSQHFIYGGFCIKLQKKRFYTTNPQIFKKINYFYPSVIKLRLKINLINYLNKILPFAHFYLSKGEIIIRVPASQLYNLASILKDHSAIQCNILSDLAALDFPQKKTRFELIYTLQSSFKNYRFVITTGTKERMPVQSLTTLYEGLNWVEREAWDMFGIIFLNHPDLRRILTDYGFKGHPLRKDFPLTGYSEVRYSNFQGLVIHDAVNLAQAYRVFHMENSRTL